ncbi:MAG: hypothetical protein KJ732_02805, partial [Candidatus Margulisbacteria bacterium]|nr:hypothetical protein [Candidatus Margulisiibacteriota bacterium]
LLDTTWGTNGVAGGQLKSVIDMGVDANKNVYIAETEGWTSGRIEKISPNGKQITNWGQILYQGPTALHVQSSGKVSAVFAFGPQPITWLYTFNSGETVFAKKEVQGMWGLGFLAVDSAGNFYLNDGGGKITKRDPGGTNVLATYDVGMINSMNERVVIDSSYNVYVLKPMGDKDGNIIFKFGKAGNLIIKVKKPAGGPFYDVAVDPSGNNIYLVGVIDVGQGGIVRLTYKVQAIPKPYLKR